MKHGMKKNLINKTQVSLLSMATCVALSSSCVYAGTAEMSSVDSGETMTYEYQGDQLRIGQKDDNEGYMLFNDAGLYIVSIKDGEPMVINAGQMMQGLGGIFSAVAPSVTTSEVVSLTATGSYEQIAGVRGEVYELTSADEKGVEETHELVLSGDSRVIELSDAMNKMASAMVAITGDLSEGLNMHMERLDMGVLRYGDDMIVTSIDSNRVADERFILPAEPMVMPNLADLMSGIEMPVAAEGEGSEGEGLSGLLSVFGKKVDRQQDRAANRTEDEIDDASDRVVDKVLDRAFGRLFGR